MDIPPPGANAFIDLTGVPHEEEIEEAWFPDSEESDGEDVFTSPPPLLNRAVTAPLLGQAVEPRPLNPIPTVGRLQLISECEGGKLYMQSNGLRVLTLETTAAKTAGIAHGYLLCDQMRQGMHAVTTELLGDSGRLVRWLSHTWIGRKLFNLFFLRGPMGRILRSIPDDIREEMEGIAEGFNKRLKEQGRGWSEQISIYELAYLNLMPDSIHYDPVIPRLDRLGRNRLLNFVRRVVGCTTIIGGNRETGPIMGRNLDWSSFNCFGELSLVVNRINPHTGLRTVEFSLPGSVGTLTGMNSHGVCVAMNVCDTHNGQQRENIDQEAHGLPAAIYNRLVLRRQSAAEARRFIDRTTPLGPYHLMVADRVNGFSQHFFQSNGGREHHRREWNPGEPPLVTVNHRYEREDDDIQTRLGFFMSDERDEQMAYHFRSRRETQYYTRSGPVFHINRALRSDDVNNDLTVHSAMLHPREMTASVAFANAHAGGQRKREVDTNALLRPSLLS